MARQTVEIITDDVTGMQIPESTESVMVQVTYQPGTLVATGETDDDGRPVTEFAPAENGEVTNEFEVTPQTAEALRYLAEGNLPEFLARMRGVARSANANNDSEVVRQWARTTHPEYGVSERGRIPADVWASYRLAMQANANSNSGGRS